MKRIHWQDYIIVEPQLHHGDPCLKGTRIPVAIILGSLADGFTVDEILAAYPQLNTQFIFAALAYAAELTRQEILAPLEIAYAY